MNESPTPDRRIPGVVFIAILVAILATAAIVIKTCATGQPG